jgi:prepilin-type N-terminal cleavage/methylation domain-containing protein
MTSESRQQGMTLMEMLLVVAIIGLLISIISSSPIIRGGEKMATGTAKQDFLGWYKRVRQDALYDSRPRRACLINQRIVLQAWENDGWHDTVIRYLPPRNVHIARPQGSCSTELNAADDSFALQVRFNEIP